MKLLRETLSAEFLFPTEKDANDWFSNMSQQQLGWEIVESKLDESDEWYICIKKIVNR